MKQRLAIDMDGVLCDLHSAWLNLYNRDYDDSLTPEDITLWDWHVLTVPECQEKVYTYLDDPNLFLNLPVIEDSQEVVKELSYEYEIFIVTAARNKNSVPAKAKWLKKHFPFIDDRNYVFTRNKSIVYADYLIDDNPDNFIGFYGKGILFDAPHNRSDHTYLRVRNWRQGRDVFLTKGSLVG